MPGTGLTTSAVLNCELTFGPAPACGFANYTFAAGQTSGVTDATGHVTLWLFPTPATPSTDSTYRFTAIPPADSGFAAATVSNIAFSTSTSVTITLGAPATLSGFLRDRNLIGVPLQSITLSPDGAGVPFTVETGADGEYAFSVPPGNYRLSILGDNRDFAYATPQFYQLETEAFGLSGNQVRNLNVPSMRLDVRVQDGASTAIPGVGLSSFGPVNCLLEIAGLAACGISQYSYTRPAPGLPPPPTGVTDAEGNLALFLFPTLDDSGEEGAPTYGLTATPLADSGFEPASVTGITVLNDVTLVIVLGQAHAAPVTTLGISPAANSDGTYPNPVEITLSATAAAGFDVETIFFELDGGGLEVYSGPFPVSGPGPHSVRYFATDTGGVAETAQFFDFSIAHPDEIPPATTATVAPAPNAAGWNTSSVTVTLNAVDNPGGSGVQQITYSIDGTPAVEVTGDSATFDITAEGVSIITFFATDVAGNVEAEQTLTVRIDRTAPEMYSRFDPDARDILFFGRDGLSGTPWAPIAPSVVSGPNGFELRTYIAEDAAGNTLRAVVAVQRATRRSTPRSSA